MLAPITQNMLIPVPPPPKPRKGYTQQFDRSVWSWVYTKLPLER